MPFFFRGSCQLVEVYWRVLSLSDRRLELFPKMFYRIKIRAASWPLQGSDTDFIEVVPDDNCDVWPGVIVHELEIIAYIGAKGTTYSSRMSLMYVWALR